MSYHDDEMGRQEEDFDLNQVGQFNEITPDFLPEIEEEVAEAEVVEDDDELSPDLSY